jgi:hypothetical protein
VELVSSFQVNDTYKVVNSICPISGACAWVACGWTSDVYLCNREGKTMKTHNVATNVDSIARDMDDNVLFSACDKRSIDQIKTENGVPPSILTGFTHYPRGFAITPDRGLLICFSETLAYHDYQSSHKNKVIKYQTDGDGDGQTEIEIAGAGADLMYPLRVAVSKTTGDICVSDCQRKRVTIFYSDGRLKATYDGAESDVKQPFDPRGISYDESGYVFVADNGNHAVHQLDHDGQFLKLLLEDKDGLYGPYSVATEEGYIWVGGRDASVKVFRYI